LGLFVYREDAMERMLDVIRWDEDGGFNIEDFQCWAIRPMMYLAKATVQADREGQDFLLEILYEKAREVDECVKRLIREHSDKRNRLPQ
jgi:hypothetical protein